MLTKFMTFGDLAVDFFFVLSGYLVAQSFLRSTSVWQYVRKRALRIYPGFVVAVLVGTFGLGYEFAVSRSTYFHDLGWKEFFRYTATLISPPVPPTLAACPRPLVNGSLWTIHFEALCYLLVLVLGVVGALQRKWACSLVFGVFVIPYLFQLDNSPLRLVSFFMAGVWWMHVEPEIPRRWLWCLVLIPSLVNPGALTVSLLFIGIRAFFWLGTSSSTWLDRLRPKDDISYGVYLYGWPVQQLLIAGFDLRAWWLLFPISLLLAAGCGWLSWKLVEAPFLKLKPK